MSVNDECADATAINLDEYVGGTTYGATGTDMTSCGWDSNNDVWYTFTADNDETLYFNMEIDNECSPCATIALFDDCPDSGGNELACESCNCYPGSAEIEYEVLTGTTYWIRAAFEEDKMGSFGIGVLDFSYCDF